MLSHHLFNYKQTKAHRTSGAPMPRHFQSHLEGISTVSNTGEAGDTDWGKVPRDEEGMSCVCPSAGPLVTHQYRSRGKGIVPPRSKLAGWLSITHL